MYNLYTGQATDGFVYIELFKNQKMALGETYIDCIWQELRVVEFYHIEEHKFAVKEMLRWKREAKKINIKLDPNFIPRTKRST